MKTPTRVTALSALILTTSLTPAIAADQKSVHQRVMDLQLITMIRTTQTECAENNRKQGVTDPKVIREACKEFPTQVQLEEAEQVMKRLSDCEDRHRGSKLSQQSIRENCESIALSNKPLPATADRKAPQSTEKLTCSTTADSNVIQCGEHTYRRQSGPEIFLKMSRMIRQENSGAPNGEHRPAASTNEPESAQDSGAGLGK